MFRHHLQFFEISLKCVKSAQNLTKSVYSISKSIKYLFIYKNISES